MLRDIPPKACILCGYPAKYSLAVVLSTLGLQPRLEQCSKVTLLCDRCIHKLANSQCIALTVLQQLVNSVYTAIIRRRRERARADAASD
jgi:hypothetical protein